MSTDHIEGDTVVTVQVTTELLADLREWSDPVQAQIIETPGVGTGYTMTFRINEANIRAERDWARSRLRHLIKDIHAVIDRFDDPEDTL